MPLYQLFAIAKPAVPLSALAAAMKRVGTHVFEGGGVVTDVTSYGQQDLAYDVKTATGKYSQGQMFLMNFAARPSSLSEIDHTLKVNEDLLRWVVLHEKPYGRLPRTQKDLQRLRDAVQEAKESAHPPVPEGFASDATR